MDVETNEGSYFKKSQKIYYQLSNNNSISKMILTTSDKTMFNSYSEDMYENETNSDIYPRFGSKLGAKSTHIDYEMSHSKK